MNKQGYQLLKCQMIKLEHFHALFPVSPYKNYTEGLLNMKSKT